jgi:octopine/nopaline transport system substrate-binding protein
MSMRNLTRLAAALIGTCVATGAFAQGKTSTQEKTWSSIKIATEGAYAPYNFMGPGGKLDGFEVELAHALCDRMKAKCEVVQQDWDGIVPALQAGKYDAIMAGMNITDKRREVLDFSMPYVREMNGFVAPKDSPLAKLANNGMRVDLTGDTPEAKKVIEDLKPILKGKSVGVQVSTIHANFMDRYFKDTLDVREYKTTEQHDLDLAAGRIDAIFASNGAERTTLEKPEFKDFAIVGPKFTGGVFGVGVGVGMRKNEPELKKLFDDAITAAKADGTLKTLSEKWFKADVTPQG